MSLIRLQQTGIADHHRHDVAGVAQHAACPAASSRRRTLRDPLLVALALGRARLQVADAGQRAGRQRRAAATVVKMKPEAKLRTKSQMAAEPAI